MTDVETKKTIVQSHIATASGLFSKEQNLRLDIAEEGSAIIDEIVFTFIVLEFRRRVRTMEDRGAQSISTSSMQMSGVNAFSMGS